MAKAAAASKKPLTKTELMANIAAATDVPKKQVAAVLEAPAAGQAAGIRTPQTRFDALSDDGDCRYP